MNTTCGQESVSSRDGRMEPSRFMFFTLLMHWSCTVFHQEGLHVNEVFQNISLFVLYEETSTWNTSVSISCAYFEIHNTGLCASTTGMFCHKHIILFTPMYVAVFTFSICTFRMWKGSGAHTLCLITFLMKGTGEWAGRVSERLSVFCWSMVTAWSPSARNWVCLCPVVSQNLYLL